MSDNGAAREPATVSPPTAELPYWHRPDGRRLGFQEIATERREQKAELSELHIQAIAALLRAGLEARAVGDDGEARRLLTNAARLCTEPVGHFPGYAVRRDGS